MTSEQDKAWVKEGQNQQNEKAPIATVNVHRLGVSKLQLWERLQSSAWAETEQAHECQAAQLSLASTGLFLKQKSTQVDAWKPSLQGKQGHISNLNSWGRKK